MFKNLKKIRYILKFKKNEIHKNGISINFLEN